MAQWQKFILVLFLSHMGDTKGGNQNNPQFERANLIKKYLNKHHKYEGLIKLVDGPNNSQGKSNKNFYINIRNKWFIFDMIGLREIAKSLFYKILLD